MPENKSEIFKLPTQADQIPKAYQVALAHFEAKKLQQAVDICQAILLIDPDHFDASYLLGVIASQTGKSDIAIHLLNKANDIRPNDPILLFNLGINYLTSNILDKAELCFQRSIELKPDFYLSYYNYGILNSLNNKTEAAISCYKKSIELNHNYIDAYNNLGAIYKLQSRLDEAMECFNKAIAIDPNHFMAYTNLGAVYLDKALYVDAIQYLNQSIKLNPNYTISYNNLGLVYRWMDKLDEAIGCFKQSIVLNPNNFLTYSHLSSAYIQCTRFDESVSCAKKSIELNPNYADAYVHLGSALMSLGLVEEAIESFRKALSLNPKDADAHSDLIFCMDLYAGADLATLSAERKRWSETHELPLKATIRPHQNNIDPERKIRIGYVSADFYDHSASKGFGMMLTLFDQSKFEVFVYANNRKQDAVTQLFQSKATNWKNIVGLPDATVAELIRQDEIDILVNLSGHSGGNRLKIFAHKPAPLQISGLGYANGTGLDSMDALFSNTYVLPFEERKFYTEEPIYMPCILSYFSPDKLPDIGPLPALSQGITFGSLNRLSKISKEVYDLWANILLSIPDSRLIIKTPGVSNKSVKERITYSFFNAGIDLDRIIFLENTSRYEHLKVMNQIDISLDPFPHGGGITTLESFLMGVPTLTLDWPTIPGRVTASALSLLGLEDWIAKTPEQYLAIAIQKSRDLDGLSELRQKLRPSFTASIMGDPLRFTRFVEGEYLKIWRQWCKNQS